MADVARLRLLLVVALIAIVLHVIEAGNYEAVKARPGKGPRCHHPYFTKQCQSSPYQHENYVLTGWFYFDLFKSCHPFYSVGGVHHCKFNEDLPRTRKECEDLCAEPCKINNGTAGICMFEKYCKEGPIVHTISMTPCKAYEVHCCLPESVSVIKDVPPTTTAVIEPANKEGVKKHNSEPFDKFLKIRREQNAKTFRALNNVIPFK